MKILIMEPNARGHHGPYLEWIVNGLLDRGFEVTVVTLPESMVHPSLQALSRTIQNGEKKSLRIVSSLCAGFIRPQQGGAATPVAREFAYWRLFRVWYKALMDTVQPDVVFLPYLDYCLYVIGLLGSPFGKCPWVGLAMRPSFHYRSMGVISPQPAFAMIKKALFFRVLSNRYLRQLLTIDELIVDYLANKQRGLDKVTFFPEPAELGDLPAKSKAKRQFGVEPERKVILLYGSVTARKGVVELLRALADPSFPPEVDVLLAGKVSALDIQEMLAKPWVRSLCDQGRLKVIDRFIETAEEPALFSAADIVWLGYRRHYSTSGVLVQATSAGCPVLACEEGILGWQTQFHNLGRTANPRNTAEVSAAIYSLLNDWPGKAEKSGRADPWRPASFSDAQDRLAQTLAGSKSIWQ
jgi:glycosyltransferase involved in cell wall biosynthesis